MPKPITSTSHPRLLHAMCWQAILSRSEARHALLSLRERRLYAGEAVAHYGGPRHVVADAWRNRHMIRRMLTTPVQVHEKES